MRKVDFTIVTIPDTIWFTCPYCGEEVGVKYGDVSPITFGMPWRDATCTGCGETVELGDYEYEN